MKVVVCVKQVPVVSLLKFDPDTRRVVREGVPAELNPYDVLAMSAMAHLKQEMPVELVAVTMGPPQARDALVQCLAMGADRAVHLLDQAFAGSDTLATARALAMALEREDFDLTLCGLSSVDAETGQVGPEVAELLGIPHVSAVRRLELSDSGRAITVERLTDEGHEVVYCPLPALITVDEGIAPEVYPTSEEMEAAKAGPISEVAAADLSTDPSLFGREGSPTWVQEIYSVEPEREGIVVRDRPVAEMVAELVDYLDGRGALDAARRSDCATKRRGPHLEPATGGSIWVVAELLAGAVRPVTFELLGAARDLASRLRTNVEAVLIGDGVDEHLGALAAHGADCVHLAEHPALASFDSEIHAHVLAKAVEAHTPAILLLSSTVNGRDLASRLAARLGLGLTGDCVGLEIDDDGRLVQLKPAFGGNIVAPIISRTLPQTATVRPGILEAVEPDWSVQPDVRSLSIDDLPAPRARVLERVSDQSVEATELEQAQAIVTVGKGVGGPENIAVVRKLVEALGGSLGATRDVVEAGWLPRQLQIGLSGKAVSPALYVAVGVRGPFNHTVGFQKAGTVVAINNSTRAPIFRSADFGIVGDYVEVVPALIAALADRQRRDSGFKD